MSASSSMTRSSRRRQRARRGKPSQSPSVTALPKGEPLASRSWSCWTSEVFCNRERPGSAVSIHGCNTNAAANESRARHLAPHRAQANSRAGPACQCLALRERWQCAALTERVRPAAASRFPGGGLPCVGTERFFQPQRRFILRHHLFFGPLLGLVEEAGGLFAGAEQFKVQRFIIRRGKHPLPCLVGDSLPRAEAKNQKRNQIL